jgi:hypothetical protein
MRPLLLIGAIALLMAGSAVAQEKRIKVVAPPAAAAGLRGPEQAGPQTATEAPPETVAALPAPALPSAPVDPNACRTDCAQAYYFCLSGPDDQCPVRWSQCVSGCIAPPQP